MKKTTVKSVYTKDQMEVLNAIDGIKRLPKPGPSRHGQLVRYKRHDKAIEQLKALGLIEKSPHSPILRRVVKPAPAPAPVLTHDELKVLSDALLYYSASPDTPSVKFVPMARLFLKLQTLLK